jgi:uncharacterized protein (DUF952 family)
VPIYKILREAEWREFEKSRIFKGSAVDLADGYIHFSTAAQAPETAAKHFANLNDLFILAVEAEDFGESIRWEPSRGGALFPHLYAPLPMERVLWAAPLPLRDGAHAFPERMA